MIKPALSQGETQELKEILKQFSKWEFEAIAQKEFVVHLKTCFQALPTMKSNFLGLCKQLLDMVTELQTKAKQFPVIKENH